MKNVLKETKQNKISSVNVLKSVLLSINPQKKIKSVRNQKNAIKRLSALYNRKTQQKIKNEKLK